MPSLRYLNSMLTVIAVLLTLNVYTMWTAAPGGLAMSPTTDAFAAEPAGLPNAGKQRKDMIDELKKLNTEVAGLKGVLTGGKIKVQVENLASD